MILELVRREVARLQADVVVVLRAILALVADVVNGEDARGLADGGIVPVPHSEIRRRQRRLPVVGVDDVRVEAHIAGQLQCGAREEGEAARIVAKVVEGVVVIETGAGEVFGRFDEVHVYAIHRRCVDGAPFLGVAHPHAHLVEEGCNLVLSGIDAAVFGHHHNNLVTERAQRNGQRPHHIGQPAGLGERHTFGSDHHNFHGIHLVYSQKPVICRQNLWGGGLEAGTPAPKPHPQNTSLKICSIC